MLSYRFHGFFHRHPHGAPVLLGVIVVLLVAILVLAIRSSDRT